MKNSSVSLICSKCYKLVHHLTEVNRVGECIIDKENGMF